MSTKKTAPDTGATSAKRYNVGVELYGLRRELESDFEGTLKKVSEIGYEYVEFYGHYAGKSAAEIKEILAKYNLKCNAVHQGAQAFTGENAAEKVKFFTELGVKYIAIPSWPAEKLRGGKEFAETVYLFTRISNLLCGAGIQLLYHNHDYEFERAGEKGPYLLDRLLGTVPGMWPELDLCWIHYGGEDPVKYLNRYKNKVDVIHLKDFACTKLGAGPVYSLVDKDGKAAKAPSHGDAGFEYRPLGKGIQDIPAILAACETSGVVNIVVEQDECYGDVFEAHKISRDYLRSLGI